MNPMILTRRLELEGLCRQYHVQRLELFGSGATEAFRPEASDLDFLVTFQPLAPAAHADAYFGLLRELEDLFQRRVDLVETGASENPYFLKAIEQSRTPLYAA